MNKLVQINIHGFDKEITCAFKTPYGMTNALDLVSTVLDAVEQSADESNFLPEAVAECIQNCMEIDFEKTPDIFKSSDYADDEEMVKDFDPDNSFGIYVYPKEWEVGDSIAEESTYNFSLQLEEDKSTVTVTCVCFNSWTMEDEAGADMPEVIKKGLDAAEFKGTDWKGDSSLWRKFRLKVLTGNTGPWYNPDTSENVYLRD